MKKLLSIIKNFFSKRTGLSLIVLAALLLELISAAQYYYTKNIIEEQLEEHAATEMTTKAILVKSMLNTTEKVINSHTANIQNLLTQPDSLTNYFQNIIKSNQNFVGSGMVFIPNYYPSKGRLFEPLSYRMGDSIITGQVASENHDYTTMDFYKECTQNDKPRWSDPYIVSVGNNGVITSYTIPIHDRHNRLAALAGIDLSLKWLSDTLNNRHIYPSSFCLLLTNDGKLISQPSSTHPRYDDFDDAIRLINDPSSKRRTVTNSEINVIEFTSEHDGQEASVFFHHMKGNPHWQVAVVCYDNEVYGELDKIRLKISLLMLLGFALLGYIIYRFFKNNKRLAKNEIEQERLNSELQVAKRIQSEMLPHDDISHSNIDIAATLLPAREVGGDIYDYFLRDDKLFFCIGDASGKGVPSALIMSVTRSMFRSFGLRESNPARIMQNINQAVCHGNDSNMFVTFFIGVLDLPTGRLHYCNAGHDTPILITGEPHKLDVKSNIVLGIVKDWFYEGQETILKSGDTLLLYTDGLTEAMDAKHNQFGLQQVLNTISRHQGNSPQQLLDALTGAESDFVGNAEQSDDLTLLAVRYSPTPEQTIMRQELTIENDLSHISQVNEFVSEFCGKLNLDKSDTTNMRLAIEEAVVNIINYAYPKGEKSDINIVASATSDTIKWMISDDGVAFAPTDAPDVDTSLSAEDRQIGGLGIFLVRQLMDT
ncbi:MAG: SpoIIE family protein phosphatase, partial [Muribaculaceae bacterium]|nr:SpoIIE family protein phosphatase [Muribaculaceae bacterium]